MSKYSDTTTARTATSPVSDAQRFEIALSQIANKRLTYAELTGKVGETSF